MVLGVKTSRTLLEVAMVLSRIISFIQDSRYPWVSDASFLDSFCTASYFFALKHGYDWGHVRFFPMASSKKLGKKRELVGQKEN